MLLGKAREFMVFLLRAIAFRQGYRHAAKVFTVRANQFELSLRLNFCEPIQGDLHVLRAAVESPVVS